MQIPAAAADLQCADRTTLVWLRRDLRLHDNPALSAAAAAGGPLIIVYVHAPEEDHPWSPGAASRWWLHQSLAALSQDLAARRQRLVIRAGPTTRTLIDLAKATGATHVVWNRLYEPAAVARDQAVESGLRALGIATSSFNASLLFEPQEIRTAQQGPFRVFTPFWRRCEQQLANVPVPLPLPNLGRGPDETITSLPLESLELLPRIRWDTGLEDTWTPGEAGAHARLEVLAEEILRDYATRRDRPDMHGTSRLSPHLHFGEIGPRQIVAALAPVARHRGAEAYLREIGWREFAHHLLHHFPQTPEQPLDERFTRYRWRSDQVGLRAWQRGMTGIPLVDAGMRELWHTGWMHNRVRMIVASFLAKNLQTHWLEGARWFWDTLVDADLANNTLGWQWTAGCGADAAPYFRVFNPVLQAERFDPERRYLRRWLPELAQLPDRWIHQPWAAPANVLDAAGVRLGKTYPLPQVDLKESRERALEGYARIKSASR